MTFNFIHNSKSICDIESIISFNIIHSCLQIFKSFKFLIKTIKNSFTVQIINKNTCSLYTIKKLKTKRSKFISRTVTSSTNTYSTIHYCFHFTCNKFTKSTINFISKIRITFKIIRHLMKSSKSGNIISNFTNTTYHSFPISEIAITIKNRTTFICVHSIRNSKFVISIVIVLSINSLTTIKFFQTIKITSYTHINMSHKVIIIT